MPKNLLNHFQEILKKLEMWTKNALPPDNHPPNKVKVRREVEIHTINKGKESPSKQGDQNGEC